jgi:hypothetical protein
LYIRPPPNPPLPRPKAYQPGRLGIGPKSIFPKIFTSRRKSLRRRWIRLNHTGLQIPNKVPLSPLGLAYSFGSVGEPSKQRRITKIPRNSFGSHAFGRGWLCKSIRPSRRRCPKYLQRKGDLLVRRHLQQEIYCSYPSLSSI